MAEVVLLERWQSWFCRLGTELAELKLLAGEKAGRAGNFGWGESWWSWNFWWGRELAELEMLTGERAGGASFVDVGW